MHALPGGHGTGTAVRGAREERCERLAGAAYFTE